MGNARHITAACAGLLIAAVAAAAAGKEARAPKQTGRLAVTISRVGPKAPVGQPIVLRSRVSWSGAKARFTYRWSSVAGPPLPDAVDPTAEHVTLPADTLEPGERYHLRLEVTARTLQQEDDEEEPLVIRAARDVKFAANEPPSGGSCTIESKAVAPNVLRIHLAAPGWTDPDGQVQYRFELIRGERVVARQNWRLFSTFTTTVRLKPGETAYGRCQIRDKFGDGGELKTDEVHAPD